MEDSIYAVHGHSHLFTIEKATVIVLNIMAERRHNHIEHSYLNTAIAQLVDDMRTNKSRTTRHKNSHICYTPWAIGTFNGGKL